jgi:hypothetical protein
MNSFFLMIVICDYFSFQGDGSVPVAASTQVIDLSDVESVEEKFCTCYQIDPFAFSSLRMQQPSNQIAISPPSVTMLESPPFVPTSPEGFPPTVDFIPTSPPDMPSAEDYVPTSPPPPLLSPVLMIVRALPAIHGRLSTARLCRRSRSRDHSEMTRRSYMRRLRNHRFA